MGAAEGLLISPEDLGGRIDGFGIGEKLAAALAIVEADDGNETNEAPDFEGAKQRYKAELENPNNKAKLERLYNGGELATDDGSVYFLSIASVGEQGRLYTLIKNIYDDDGTFIKEEPGKHLLTVVTFEGEFAVHTDNEAVATKMIDEFIGLLEAQE